MLHKETVQREIFKLLTSLMQDQELSAFNLAGGTALALLMGHRMSIDLDLFTPTFFDPQKLERHLIEKYNFQSSYLRGYTLKGTIQHIKIDCIMHIFRSIQVIKGAYKWEKIKERIADMQNDPKRIFPFLPM